MAFPFEGSSLLDRGPAAGVAEPTWNTWTMVATGYFGVEGYRFENLIVDNNGVAWADDTIASNQLHRFDRNGVHVIYANMEHSTYWDPNGWSKYYVHHSILYRYVLTCDIPNFTIFNVIRDYAVIFTRDLIVDVPNQDYIYIMAMSPNGRYIAIISQSSFALTPCQITIYEGS